MIEFPAPSVMLSCSPGACTSVERTELSQPEVKPITPSPPTTTSLPAPMLTVSDPMPVMM